MNRIRRIFRSIGPGFITGAADDDPSGIGTYSQTGALFGYQQLWLEPFTLPFMIAMQEMCGRIGLVSGRGLAAIIKKSYSKPLLYTVVSLLLIANTVNIGADLGAMASSVQLLLPVPFAVLLLLITAGTLLLVIFVSYPTYAQYLKYLTLTLLAYVAAVFFVKPDWHTVLQSTVIPHVEFSSQYVLNMAAYLGTTISPYLFFWQADEEVEEEVEAGKLRDMGRGRPKLAKSDIREMRIDTIFGMLFSNLISFFIVVTVAATLGAGNMHTIQTASDAAEALKPFAGDAAFLLFTLGILSTGLLAVPVLAGSAAYATAEAFNWNEGLSKRFRDAYGFYGIITIATIVGLAVNFLQIPTMTMLYYSAALNGLLAPPLMVVVLLLANNKKLLGHRTNGYLANTLGIIITVAMSICALAFLWSLL